MKKYQQFVELATETHNSTFYMEIGPGEDSHPTDCHDGHILYYGFTPDAEARVGAIIATAAWLAVGNFIEDEDFPTPDEMRRLLKAGLEIALATVTESIRSLEDN